MFIEAAVINTRVCVSEGDHVIHLPQTFINTATADMFLSVDIFSTYGNIGEVRARLFSKVPLIIISVDVPQRGNMLHILNTAALQPAIANVSPLKCDDSSFKVPWKAFQSLA